MIEYSNKYLFQTDYFHRTWTWIRRGAAIVVFSLGIILWNMDDDALVFKPILISIIVFGFVVKPKDDVAISSEYFFHVRRSVLPAFTKVQKYKLEDVISIRCSGVHNDSWELVDFFGAGGNMGGHSNTLEMTFKNNSSRSFDLAISRDNLNKVVALANGLRQRTGLKEKNKS